MKKTTLYSDMLLLIIVLFFSVVFTLCVLIPYAAASTSPVASFLLLFFLIAVILFCFFWLSRRIIRPAKEYRNLCLQFNNGEIYQNFINTIGGLFPFLDTAVKRLDSLLGRQNTLQLSTKQAEFLALQNQINPHFLYNTLESIRGDALAAGMENIANITEALSTFFRYTITETRNLVSLREELDNVKNYFVIQQYRFGDKLSIAVNIVDEAASILNLQCPKLFLQPIVENAVFHGLERKSENGLVSIRVEIIDQEVHIDISDNGVGMQEEILSKLNGELNRVSAGAIVENKKGGIALKNVCRRIKLLFGEQYGIHVSSIIGIGTKVEVTLPIIYKE